MREEDQDLSSDPRLTVLLGRRLRFEEAPGLAMLLLGKRGAALEIDASEVSELGTPCLQVLLAAAVTWRTDGEAFSLANPSPEMLAILAQFGLDAGALNSEGRPE